jgi:hypothetical protein
MENSGTIGNFGTYSLVVAPNGIATATMSGKYPQAGTAVLDANTSVKFDLIEALKLAARETTNGVDDIMVAMIAKAFGR